MTDLRTVSCVLRGDTLAKSIRLQIEPTASVKHLKSCIKSRYSPIFKGISASDIVLWEIWIPSEDEKPDYIVKLVDIQKKSLVRAPLSKLVRNQPLKESM